MMHRLLVWVGSWIALFQAATEILTFGCYYPRWESMYLGWVVIKQARSRHGK